MTAETENFRAFVERLVRLGSNDGDFLSQTEMTFASSSSVGTRLPFNGKGYSWISPFIFFLPKVVSQGGGMSLAGIVQ